MYLGSAIGRIASGLTFAVGWHRWIAAFLLGATGALAQPPFHVLPLLIISFSGLVWLLDGALRTRSAFVVGWMFAAGYFGAGLYWVSHALLVEADKYAWLIPFAFFGLSFGLGLFGGITAVIARWFWTPGLSSSLALAASWAFLEMLRGVVLTGFPWNPVGNVWVVVPEVLQAASWVGVYGLSALTVFSASCFSQFAVEKSGRALYALSGIAILGTVFVGGSWRLSQSPELNVPNITLRIVQPNIAQKDKWRLDRQAQNYSRHLQMSGRRGDGTVTHVVWPETAAPFSVSTNRARRGLMRSVIPPGGYLLVGAPRVKRYNGGVRAIWNSLIAVGADSSVVAIYDKHHLVPFGEYVPFRRLLPIEKLTAGKLDFSAGPGLRTVRLPGLPAFSPLICYEAIFPGRVAAVDDRPKWLLNITNDAWFGHSAGPHQHFASALLRGVEEGLPLVRAANTGISAVVDPYGRILGKLGIGERGVLDLPLPAAVSQATLFARFGNLLPSLLIIIMFACAALSCRINTLYKKKW